MIKPILAIPLGTSRIKLDKGEREILDASEFERGANGSMSLDRNILNSMPILKERIMRSVGRYVKEAMGVDWDYKMMNSWCLKHLYGDMGQPHSHCQSWISGCYYTDVRKESGDILFLKENKNFFNLSHAESTGYNHDYHCHTPVEGDLLLFPSHVKHAIDMNAVQGFQRRCIAFNILPNGVVGSNENLDYMYV